MGLFGIKLNSVCGFENFAKVDVLSLDEVEPLARREGWKFRSGEDVFKNSLGVLGIIVNLFESFLDFCWERGNIDFSFSEPRELGFINLASLGWWRLAAFVFSRTSSGGELI